MFVEIRGLDHAVETLNDMLQQTRAFKKHVDEEFFNWQAEEMHRMHPSVHHRDRETLYTVVRPHSLREMQRSRKRIRKVTRFERYMAQHPNTRRRRPRAYRKTSSRPVLREELFRTLQARMQDLMRRFHW